ncbi:MAG: hypothetical protein JSV31_01375 [Desulfobacterales bacterium]|nr:MAG: hypothetical protein JSV31_01375 [Desulfobacterales bacterium]
MAKLVVIFLVVFVIPAFLSCTEHKVEVAPVEVKPIHITIDVNVKVDKALDDFFDDIDSEKEKIESTSSTEQ